MNKQFTASEVRRTAAAIEGKQMLVSSMLRAYADRLEAREKAVPVAFRYLSQQSSTLAWVWSGWLDLGDLGISALHVHCKTSGDTKIEYAYAHPAPSDAERLAEALRACALNWQEIAAATWRSYSVSASNVDKASAIAHMHCAQDIRKALAAHCAQAQPPAARVPGVSAQAHEKAQAALAAQENPNG